MITFEDPKRTVKCGRCHKSIKTDEAETCWYCLAPLCVTCWDTYGHCGHPQADKINADARDKKPDIKPDAEELQ